MNHVLVTILFDCYSVHTRILHLDANYLVIYSCMTIQADGSCHPEHTFLDIMGHQPGVLQDDLRERFKFIIKQSCFEVGDLHQPGEQGICYLMMQIYINKTECVYVLVYLSVCVGKTSFKFWQSAAFMCQLIYSPVATHRHTHTRARGFRFDVIFN